MTYRAQYLQWWKQLLHSAPCGEAFVWLHGTPQKPQSLVWFWPVVPWTSALLAFSAALTLSLSLMEEAFALLLAVVALAPSELCEWMADAAFSLAIIGAVSLLFDTMVALDVCWFEVLLLLPPFTFGLAYSIRYRIHTEDFLFGLDVNSSSNLVCVCFIFGLVSNSN